MFWKLSVKAEASKAARRLNKHAQTFTIVRRNPTRPCCLFNPKIFESIVAWFGLANFECDDDPSCYVDRPWWIIRCSSDDLPQDIVIYCEGFDYGVIAKESLDGVFTSEGPKYFATRSVPVYLFEILDKPQDDGEQNVFVLIAVLPQGELLDCTWNDRLARHIRRASRSRFGNTFSERVFGHAFGGRVAEECKSDFVELLKQVYSSCMHIVIDLNES